MTALLRRLATTLCLSGLLALGGCTGIGFLNAITPTNDYSLLTDLGFGTNGQRLDVYKPDATIRNAPVLVFIYGGSWQKGTTLTKSKYRFLGEALAARGFVVVIADYRLYPVVKYPAFLEDCADAVVWAHTWARAYGGDPDKLVVMGHSAGAYNAAMLALDPTYLRRAGGDRAWIKALVGLAGPYDFLPLDDETLEAIFSPAQPLTDSQPINHVDGRQPPMLLLAGDDDTIVYAKNSRNLANTIRAKGGVVEEYIYPSMSHVKLVATTASRLQGFSDVMPRIVAFTAKYVTPGQ